MQTPIDTETSSAWQGRWWLLQLNSMHTPTDTETSLAWQGRWWWLQLNSMHTPTDAETSSAWQNVIQHVRGLCHPELVSGSDSGCTWINYRLAIVVNVHEFNAYFHRCWNKFSMTECCSAWQSVVQHDRVLFSMSGDCVIPNLFRDLTVVVLELITDSRQ